MSILCALVSLASLTTVGFLVEAWLHRRRLNRIPLRIHVNGTRGKSSVTRLIAAGLRGGGIATCAKTTGTLARMIFPSGHELPIYRFGRTNVIEQKRVVRAAVAANAEALVIECMALQPLLQSTCELQLVRSTHGVITNARPDHLDVMGPTRLDVAKALAGTMPVSGSFFTAETRPDAVRVMKQAAEDRGSEINVVQGSAVSSVTEAELAKFSYLEHADNVALALEVCRAAGVKRESALESMWAATPDPGAMWVHEVRVRDASWHFVNGFAANDPESTGQIWETAYNRFPGVAHRVMVVNCRVDRPDRSASMGAAIGEWSVPDQMIVIGSGTDVFLRTLFKAEQHRENQPNVDSSWSERVTCLGDATSEEVAEAISMGVRRTGCDAAGTMIMGIGNVAGPGLALDAFFQTRETWDTRPDVSAVSNGRSETGRRRASRPALVRGA
ncbi:MAG: poly-gamma-glutamate synthase PgsB [Planctomycetota bacterium]